MSRLHLYSDRAIIVREGDGLDHGEVTDEGPADIGDWIPALLKSPSGKVDPSDVRTSVPENATLILHTKDLSGDAVSLLPGDRFKIKYNENGVLIQRPKTYRIMGDIVKTRAKQHSIESYHLEVQMEKEF